MNNKLNDIEYDEVKILIIEELTKYANEHSGFVNNKYLESLDLFNLIDIDDIEEIKSKLAENQVEFIDEGENLEDIEITDDLRTKILKNPYGQDLTEMVKESDFLPLQDDGILKVIS